MPKTSNQDRARNVPVKGGSKVPLTYYRSAQKQDKASSPFVRNEQPRSRLKNFLLGMADILLIIVLIAVFIYSLMVKPIPKLEVNSEAYHSKQVYTEAIAKELSSTKNRNKLTFNEDEITKNLKKEFPEIADVTVILPIFSQKPNIKLNVSSISFVIKNQKNSYLVNEDGRLVAYKADFPQLKNLPEVQDETGFQLDIGKQVLDKKSVNFIRDVVVQLKHSDIHIKSIKLPPKAQELYVYLEGKPYYVKFYLGDNSLQQIGQFIAVYQKLDESHKIPAKYIDARVLGKVFYK